MAKVQEDAVRRLATLLLGPDERWRAFAAHLRRRADGRARTPASSPPPRIEVTWYRVRVHAQVIFGADGRICTHPLPSRALAPGPAMTSATAFPFVQ